MLHVRAVMLAVVLGCAGACGSDSGPGGDTGEAPDVGLSPPGAPLAEGLVVPVGADLVGPVFPAPVVQDSGSAGGYEVAVLQVDGDPFAAWDDLASQARDLGLPIPGSGVCMWYPAMGASGAQSAETSVAAGRPDAADLLGCTAAASGARADGGGLRLTVNMWWVPSGAELQVEFLSGDVSDYITVYPEADPGPAPAGAAGQLTDREALPTVEPGDPFGQTNNCFESGYDQLVLPAGARLVGGGNTPGLRDFAAVLAVEDPEAVLTDVRDQLDDPADSAGHYDLVERQLADGTRVWHLSGYVDAGGGACEMWASPDGNAVLVTTTSD